MRTLILLLILTTMGLAAYFAPFGLPEMWDDLVRVGEACRVPAAKRTPAQKELCTPKPGDGLLIPGVF